MVMDMPEYHREALRMARRCMRGKRPGLVAQAIYCFFKDNARQTQHVQPGRRANAIPKRRRGF